MRNHEPNVDNLEIKANLHDKPVFVAANIENHSVASKNTRVTVTPSIDTHY
jgi:hypothetical protein